jgi:serine/threonine protein kinase
MAIVQQPVSFESSAAQQLSAAARSVIERLLEKDPALRLGSRRGAGELKRHPFFEPVHWALLAHSKPPLVLAATLAATTATAAATAVTAASGSVAVDDAALAELQSAVHKSWTWDAFDDTASSQHAELSSSSAIAVSSDSAAKQNSSSNSGSGNDSDSVGTNPQARHTSDGFAAYDFCADEAAIATVDQTALL